MKNLFVSNNNLMDGTLTSRVLSRISGMHMGNRLDSILSRLCLVSLILMTIGVGQAWGGTYKTNLTVNIEGGGKIKLSTSSAEPSNWSTSSLSLDNSGSNFWTAGSCTYHVWVQGNSGCWLSEFKSTGTLSCTIDKVSEGHYSVTCAGTAIKLNYTITATFVTNFYSKAEAHAVPSFGKVYVGVGGTKYDDGADSRGWSNPGSANTYDWTQKVATSAPTYKYHFYYKENPTGYSFDGWYRDAACTNLKTSDAEIKENVTATTTDQTNLEYWAHWSPIQYTITFNKQNGTGGTDNAKVHFDNNDFTVTPVVAPTRTGYTFAGYYTEANGGGVQLVNASGVWQSSKTGYLDANGKWVKAENTTLYAKWTANQYDVTLNANGGSSSDQIVRATFDAAMPTTLKAGGAIATPVRTDYTFVGYFDAQTGGTKYYNADLTSARTWNYASNKTLYAHWEATYYGRAESYSNPAVAGGTWVSCNGNKPSKPEDYKAQDYSNWQSATTLAAAPTCSAYFEESQADGYKFVGWYTGENGTGDLKSSAVSYTEEFTVTAVNKNPRTTITRYAYFVPVTVNSVSPATTTLTFTQPETKSVKLTFNVSNADEAADFNEPVISNTADWSLTSWSYANNQVTVVVAMTVTGNVTASGAHNTTVTLTSKGTSDNQSKTATINATVNMDPVITCTIGDNYMVDAPALDLNTLWTSTSNGTKTYSVVSFTPANSNDVATAPAVNGSSLSLSQAGTVVLKLAQAVSTSYNAAEATKTITIHKYNSTYAGVEDLEVKVDENVVSGYTLTYTKPDAAYIGEDNIAAGVPTLGENTSNCFYTIAHNVTTSVTAGSPDASLAFAYNAGTKTATGKNQGVGTVALTQLETYKYNAATDTFRVMVSKHANAISCSWDDWIKDMSKNSNTNITLAANNTNYSQFRIQITQTYGEEVATLTDNNATSKTIATNNTNGYATWYLYQEANYKYNAAEADVMVTVGVPAPPTCYVLEDYTTHEFKTHINDWEGHFDTPIAINAPVDKIWFTACRQVGGFDYFTVEYTVDNGAHWRTIVDNPGLSTSDRNYGPYSFPGLQSNEKVTHIRFGAKQGATLKKWYKNIKVSRKAYLNIQDALQNNISTLAMPNNTIGNSTTAKIYVDYSTCADIIRVESNNPHFTLNKSQFTSAGDNRDTNKEEIVITYTNNVESKDTAIISVYTTYQRKVIRVTAETIKRVQTLTWQEYEDLNFTTTSITVPVGVVVDNNNPAALASSNNLVTYTSGNEEIVRIINEGYGFEVIGAGTTTLTVSAAENDTWSPVSETKSITATDKIIQEISWQQTFPLRMQIGDVIDLEAEVYLRNTSTGAKTLSAERTAELTYSCPNNNNVITLNGAQMTVVGYGSTTITARVAGNEKLEAAAPVTLTVVVREPSSGCETPLTFYHGESIEIFLFDFSFTDWQTPQITTDALAFDLTNGKPDKLSFQHEGEPYTVLSSEYYGGTVLVQEHVNNGWQEVANSRVQPTKNAWNTKENLQLSEGADSIRFVRLAGGTGYHYIKDIQVTLRQYLRTAEASINFGDVKVGEIRKDTIGLEYSNLKGDITASRVVAADSWLTIANEGVVGIACGTHGHYDVPIAFAPKAVGEWKDTIRVYDNLANLEVRIALVANVIPADDVIFTTQGTWGTDANWSTNAVPDPTANVTVEANVSITGNVTINSLTIADDATVTVTSGNTLTIGAGTPNELTGYGNLHVEEGARVIVNAEGKLNVKGFYLDALLGNVNHNASSGQIYGEAKMEYEEAYFQMTFDPCGHITYGWYDFVVPFEVNIADGITRLGETEHLVDGTDFIVMQHSEAARARGTRDWSVIHGTMYPGQVYTITFDSRVDQNTFLFKKKSGAALGGANTFTAVCSQGDADKRGWNGLGNGTLQHKQLAGAGKKVQLYDHANNIYVTREADNYKFAVGTSFFIQVATNNTTITLDAAGNRAILAPARDERTVEEFRLGLTTADATQVDQLWVSANEEATGEYTIGSDLLKMSNPTEAKIAQVWAVNADLKLCDIEMPLVNGDARCELGLYAPEAGEYTLAIERAPEEASLFLTYNNRVIWNLSVSPYTFDLSKGTTEGYGLRLVAEAPQMHTDIEETGADAQGVKKMLIDNVLYIVTPEGAMFNASGLQIR